MSRSIVFLFVAIMCSVWAGCGTSKRLSNSSLKSLAHVWDSLKLDKTIHTGLVVNDVQKNKNIFDQNGSQFFTPASTVKILTLFASLTYLPEVIPAAYYMDKGDTLIVWGSGDPGANYPDIKSESSLGNFLKEREETILFSNHHFQTTRFGSGWAWDDFPYGFQVERNAYPIFGNRLWVERSRDTVRVTPSYFNLVVNTKKDTTYRLTRNEWGTRFEYRYDMRQTKAIHSAPLSLFENDIKGIWRQETGKEIFFSPIPFDSKAFVLSGSIRDTLLKTMMQESDNFIAEQLLLTSSLVVSGMMNEKKIIRHILENDLQDLPDTLIWVDGSGLSRYNKLTPHNVVDVLKRLIKLKGVDYVKSIFPAGGSSGTLTDVYHSGEDEPFIYAKSGSMRNVYGISGLLMTRSNDVLLFSWLNDDINVPSKKVIASIQVFLNYLRDHY